MRKPTPALITSVAAAAFAVFDRAMRRRPGLSVATSARPLPVPPATDVPQAAGNGDIVPGATAVPSVESVLRHLHGLDFEEGETGRPEHAEVAEAVRSGLARIESQPHYLPRRPLVLPQLMRSVNDPDGSARAVAAIVERDPALAAHLLRVANSAYYRVQARPVASLERAVAMIGTDGLRRIVAAAVMQPVSDVGGGVFGRASANAWEHALLAGEAAAELARCGSRDDPLAAHLLNLLLGLGTVVVLQVLRDEYARRPGLAPVAGIVATMLETEAAPMAALIAAKWGLAENLRATLQAPMPDWHGEAPHTLGQALHAGRIAAALVVLHRHGRIGDDDALRCLAQAMPAREAARLWRRLPGARRID